MSDNDPDPHSAETQAGKVSEKPDTQDSPVSALLTVEGTKLTTRIEPALNLERFGHYEIAGVLGSGGMGTVYKAYDPALKRFAALKLIRKDDPHFAQRFVQEAQAQARVQHDNVCKVYEVGELDGRQFIAMQLIDGKTLSEASKEMPLDERIRVLQQIAEALDVAHRHGLIHRDIKPANIMVERYDEGRWKPYILDFGLARDQEAPGLTRTGMAIGTPYYMAPEQVSGERMQWDRRTDVYGLGATLYELLSGRPPYDGSNGAEIMLKILKEDPVPLRLRVPNLPQDLQTIVQKSMERDPARRYDTAKTFSQDLQRYLNGDPIAAKPSSLSYRMIKRAKKNRLATAILIAAGLILVSFAAVFAWFQWQNNLQANFARVYGDEIKNIQMVLPSIYGAPLHDIRPDMKDLRIRLQNMEQSVQRGGRPARDPGYNALGQGYLALGEYQKAREYLEKAWNSGYQTPSTAYALGQTMGILFEEKLDEASHNANEIERDRKIRQYEKEYRNPAVQYLTKAEGAVESPAYVEGLIALYQKHYNVAIEKAKQAYARTRWSYEAKTLEGRALAGMGREKVNSADYKGAIEKYQLAGIAYGQAAELGRSRADIYLNDCERWAHLLDAQGYIDMNPVVSLPKAEETCNKAILVNPDDPLGYLRKAYMFSKVARYQMYNSPDDPRTLLKKSIESAQQALRIDSSSWRAHQSLLSASMLSAEYELRHGMDPRNSAAEAIQQADHALSLSPQKYNADTYLDLGITYSFLAEYDTQNGRNPIPMYEKSIDYYHKIDPHDQTMDVGNQLGIDYWFIGQYQSTHGQDPSGNYDKAVEAYRSSLKHKQEDPIALYNLGCVYADQANYEASLGKDPTGILKESISLELKASNSMPGNPYILNMLGFDYYILADYLVENQKDASDALSESRKYFVEANKIDATYFMPYSNLGDLEQVHARMAIQKGKSPIDSFQASRKAYLKSIKCNKEEPATYSGMANTYRQEADWRLQQKQSATASISSGFEYITKSLAMSADNPDSLAIQGALFLLKAKTEKNAAQRSQLAASAATALQKAIQLNPVLAKDYQPLLTEATNLQSQP